MNDVSVLSTRMHNKPLTGCQPASTRKRKTSPVLIDKSVNGITKCKDFFKANEGMSLCSELVSLRVKSGTNLSWK